MSENYVKKYDVGQIKLDLPYANYIHELPLLSFGDVQHTINLSLVFNYARKAEGDNSFNIANGFKLNMQKRIIKTNGTPVQFEEADGRLVDLTYTCDGYTFDDKTQRILRSTSSGYEIEYPDFSKEIFNGNGYITGVYSKYDKTTAFLTYGYTSNRLASITYRGTKTITLNYNSSNKLSSITYDNKVIGLVHGSNTVKVQHFSEVDYHFNVSGNNLVVHSTDKNASYSSAYSHRMTCTKNTDSLTVKKEIGSETVDTTTYDFLSVNGDKITLLDITNKNGVKTRTHFKDDKLLYSYETGLPNNGFVNDKYCGNVNIHNVFNNASGIYTKSIQKPNHGTPMEMTDGMTEISWSTSLPTSAENDGIYILSGWIKLVEDTDSDTIEMIIGQNINDIIYGYFLPKPPVGEWTYFSVGMPYTLDNICAYIKKINANVETKDFRISFQQSFVNDTTCIDDLVYEEDILILEGANGNPDQYLSPTLDCQFYNGSTIIEDTVTMRDVLQYKINQMYGTHKNTIYYDDYKKAVTSAGALCVTYDGNIYPISVLSLAVGKRRYANGKIHITKTNFYRDNNDNNNYSLMTKSYIDNVCYKEDIYNDKLDIVSSTVEDATTHYDYVSETCGLVYKKTITPKGVDKLATTRSDVMVTQYNYDSGLTKINSVIDEFGNTTHYTTDSVWGVVTSVTLPDGTVVTDDYDNDKCALLSREFSNETNPRKTVYSYSNGNLAALTHIKTTDNNVESIDFSFTYDKDKLVNTKKCTNHLKEQMLMLFWLQAKTLPTIRSPSITITIMIN